MNSTTRTRRRSFLSQFFAVILRPVAFFRDLPPLAESRQWLLAAVVLIAISAGSALYMRPSGVEYTASETWTLVILTAVLTLAAWLALALLLALVSLFGGRRPRFGANLQIAVWSSVPFALMSLLGVLYVATGGQVLSAGLTRLVWQQEAVQTAPDALRLLILALFANITVFGLWHLIVAAIGARVALRGPLWGIAIVLLLWVAVTTAAPVVLDRVPLPSDQAAAPGGDMGGMPGGDFGGMPGGDMGGMPGGDMGGVPGEMPAEPIEGGAVIDPLSSAVEP
jgi:hypothetical protein